MPTPTYIALQNTTLGSLAASVTFSSIPATFRDLVVITNVDGTAQTEMFVRLNGDTGNNYNTIRMQGNGSITGSGSTTNADGARLNGNGDIMTDFSFSSIIHIMDYSATNKHKTGLSRTNSSNGVDACAFRWANTNAVTSVTVYPAAGSFDVGSTFALYGIVS
jgi:hypothetical protein